MELYRVKKGKKRLYRDHTGVGERFLSWSTNNAENLVIN